MEQKYVLAGGGYSISAPRYPKHQLRPGFVDEVLILNAEFRPLYTLALLENGLPLTLTCDSHAMKDGVLVVEFGDGHGLKMIERRFVSADDRFVSQVELRLEGKAAKADRELTVVMWTYVDPEGEAVSLEGDSFRIRRMLQPSDLPQVPVDIHWNSPDSKGARCLQPYFCEGGSEGLDWRHTPWYDKNELTTPRAKRPMEKPSPILPQAKVYCGLFRHVQVKPGTPVSHRFEANVVFKSKGFTYRARRPDPKDENGWQAFWSNVPKFQSEWKQLESVVRSRFRLLYLLRIPHGAGLLSSPSVCEGTGMFHAPTSFSAPSIMRDARWLQDPTLGRGIVKVFFDNIRQNGMVPGRVFMTGLSSTDFYHADWGGGFEALDDMHPDRATKRAVLMAMQRYVKWLANNRDPEGSGLTDIVNHFEAGQEFSRRYTVVDEKADRAEGFDENFRLKGIDASVFRYRLVSYLARVADDLQEKAMANRFLAEKEAIQDAIRKRMWDEKAGLFMDVDPKARRRTNVKAAVGFYPLGTDIPNAAQVDRLVDVLADRKEFWTKYPVPSLAMSDPYYSPEGLWKGTRRGCTWNGRVWPTINSHVMEGLSYWAERGHKKAAKLNGELLKKTVAMASGELEGLSEPVSCEHYSPDNGRGSRYRGHDHYLHSFVLDNIFRVACGFVVRFGEVQLDPVADDMPDFKLSGVPVGNKRFTVERKGSKQRVVAE
ncbi:MAG: trehalase family glycosidase [Planctomycetota bacterium]